MSYFFFQMISKVFAAPEQLWLVKERKKQTHFLCKLLYVTKRTEGKNVPDHTYMMMVFFGSLVSCSVTKKKKKHQ